MKIYDYEMTVYSVSEVAMPPAASEPEKIVQYMTGAFDKAPEQESFWIIFLNRKNVPTGRIMLTLGTLTSCLAHPREVLRAVIMANASAFTCVHNHPSGDPHPSAPDMHITRMIREAAKVVDIPFMDHVIIGTKEADPTAKGYFSFREAGII